METGKLPSASEVARDFLELLRSSITTATWTALSIAICLFVWQVELFPALWAQILFCIAITAVASFTTAGAITSMAVLARNFAHRLLPKANRMIWSLLTFLILCSFGFLACTAIVFAVPILRAMFD